MVTVEQLSEENDFFDTTSRITLKDNYKEPWYIVSGGILELDVSHATDTQRETLLRRLHGYQPVIMDNKLIVDLWRIIG